MRFATSLLSAVILCGAPSALADDTKACTDSFEQTQYLQKDNKLRAAREQAAICAREVCPKFVRDECTKWISNLETTQPTVVVSAHDDKGADLIDVRVDVDGSLLQSQVTGTAVAIDPGPHTLRFTHEGQAPIEQKVVIRVTEKNRVVQVDFPASGAASTPPQPPMALSRGPLWPGLVVAGVGLVAIGASIVIGVSAKNAADDLQKTCAPRCSHDDVSAINTKVIVSDVLLGAGVVAAGVATWLLIARPGGHADSQTAFSVGPTRGGAAASMTLSF